MRPAQWRAALLLCALTLAGCALPIGGEVRVHIENQTDAPVAVYVNGGWVGTYPPDTETSAPIAGHGGPPYTVVGEGPGGAVLTSLVVAANDAASIASGSTMMETSVAVECGYVRIVIATPASYDATSITDPDACPGPS
ncbi:MAG: hypothetical protein K0S97_1848 [Chloroflexota bacterium]|jgi:hypothetical protein|nr:hypothetical protein [Chloroflexota bacterium]